MGTLSDAGTTRTAGRPDPLPMGVREAESSHARPERRTQHDEDRGAGFDVYDVSYDPLTLEHAGWARSRELAHALREAVEHVTGRAALLTWVEVER